jgi:tetratricopeptide (TPR) repeat protein
LDLEFVKKLSKQKRSKLFRKNLRLSVFKYRIALKYLKKALDLYSEPYGQSEALVELGKVYFRLQKYDEAIDNLQEGINLQKILGNSNKYSGAYIFLSDAYIRLGNILLAEDKALTSLNSKKIYKNDFFTYLALDRLGDINFYKGELKTSFELYYKNAEIGFRGNYLYYNLGEILTKIARLKASEGNFLESENYLVESLECFYKSNEIGAVYQVTIFLGYCTFEMGDYERTLTILNNLNNKLEQSQENHKPQLGLVSLNLAKLYLIAGDPKVFEYYERAKIIFEELELTEGLVETYLGTAMAYDESPESNEYFFKASNLIKALKGNNLAVNERIYNLCLISIENGIGNPKKYIEVIYPYIDCMPKTKKNDQKLLFLSAIKLKYIKRLKEQGKSLELFETILNQDLMDYYTTLLAYLNILEIKIFELKISGDLIILQEANKLLEEIIAMTTINNFSVWVAKTLALKSQVKLIELQFDEAKQCLNDAISIASKINIKRLVIDFNNQYDDLLEKISKLRERKSKNFAERLEITNLTIFNKESAKLNLEIPKEESIYLSFINNKGLTIYSNKFIFQFDENFDQLMSGFLVAINSVILRLFSSSGFIERIKHNEFTVMIMLLVEGIYICYVFKGPSYHAQEKIEGLRNVFLDNTLFNILNDASNKNRTLNGNEIKIINDNIESIF